MIYELKFERIVVYYIAHLFLSIRLLKCKFDLNCLYERKVDVVHFKQQSIVQLTVSNLDLR